MVWAPSAARSASMPLAPARGGSRTMLAKRSRLRFSSKTACGTGAQIHWIFSMAFFCALRLPRNGQSKIAGTGKQLEHAVAFLKITGAEQFVENAPVARWIYLREHIG